FGRAARPNPGIRMRGAPEHRPLHAAGPCPSSTIRSVLTVFAYFHMFRCALILRHTLFAVPEVFHVDLTPCRPGGAPTAAPPRPRPPGGARTHWAGRTRRTVHRVDWRPGSVSQPPRPRPRRRFSLLGACRPDRKGSPELPSAPGAVPHGCARG